MMCAGRAGSVATAKLCMAVVLTAFCLPSLAQNSGTNTNADAVAGQAALANAEMVHAEVRVVAINTVTNSVTIRGPRGNLADIDVNPAIADVSKLHVGDRLNVAYQQALLLKIDRMATKGVRERIETTTTIPAAGGYASSAHRVLVVATVVKINRKNRLVTLRGPKHRQVLRAAIGIPLDQLKVGDSVRAEFISAAVVELVRK